jgi:hypothetical protein
MLGGAKQRQRCLVIASSSQSAAGLVAYSHKEGWSPDVS